LGLLPASKLDEVTNSGFIALVAIFLLSDRPDPNYVIILLEITSRYNSMGKIEIDDLGYNSFFESSRKQLGLMDFSVARVISEFRAAYRVKSINGEFLAKVRGKQMLEAASREDYPAVGDWVAITELDNNNAIIEYILPRLTIIKRKHGEKNRIGNKDKTQIIAANIDIALVIESVDRDYNLNRFERYFAIAENGGVKPAIVINKIDLLSKEELSEKLTHLKKRFPGADIILTSAVSNEGLAELKKYMTFGKTYCFLGSSGVGKSSLINKLLGEKAIKTSDISSFSGRGRHITSSRQMYFLEGGGIVIDNPGMREVGMGNTDQGINSYFNEIISLRRKCKFSDCTHVHEKGCQIVNAVKSGELDEEKYSNYINLKKEADYYGMNDFEKREKDRKFGKFIKQAKKELNDFGRKS
jgi:ribosome biogenesis GTPase